MNQNEVLISCLINTLNTYVRWMGSTRLPSSAKYHMYTGVRTMWETGELPFELKPGLWVAGYNIHLSFAGSSTTPITVGPKKPSKFRNHYAVMRG